MGLVYLQLHFLSPMIMSAYRIGRLGETLAYSYLCAQGLQRLTRNYRCAHGEIDLIMADAQTIVFIEVKTSLYCPRTPSILRIDLHKQKRIHDTANHYLYHHTSAVSLDVRFDVALVQIFPLHITWQHDRF